LPQAFEKFDSRQSVMTAGPASILHQRRSAMPVDSMLVSLAVILMFVVFAAALAWADFQTRPKQLAQQFDIKRRAF
jgi:uncharacterized membrane protein